MKRALIITDVQNDFMPKGALAVAGADAIIPVINQIIPKFDHVFAVLDWHPLTHVSFAATHHKKSGSVLKTEEGEQILWPMHCVQDTEGAELAYGLKRDKIEQVFHKGVDVKVDSYSAFFDQAKHRSTGLADALKKLQIKELYFAGVATDYCIRYSVLDALKLGFKVVVIRDACRAINREAGDEEKALEEMQAKGAKIGFSKEIV